MYLQKIVSLISAIVLVLCCAAPASASTVNIENEICPPNTMYKAVHVLDGMTRSLSIPTTLWNLSKNDYSATLEKVGRSMLYTNYYFKPNSNGTIYVDYDVVAQGAATFRIGVYNIDTAAVVASNDIEVNAKGKKGTATFSSLKTSTNYAIFFMSVYDGWSVVYLSGSAKIYH